MLKLFEAALANPTVPPIARATLYHSLRAYHHRVIGDPATALRYAELAIAQTPGNWELHDRRVRLLAILGRWAEAEAALQEAVREDRYKLHREAARRLAASIDAARRGEPIAAAASDEGRPEHERHR